MKTIHIGCFPHEDIWDEWREIELPRQLIVNCPRCQRKQCPLLQKHIKEGRTGWKEHGPSADYDVWTTWYEGKCRCGQRYKFEIYVEQ